MRDVVIIGIGQTAVGEHWGRSIRDLATEAIAKARADAGIDRADVLYVGNMASGALCGQENLGTLVADAAGLLPIEAVKIEAACASGGAAVRAAYLAVAGGAHDYALAVGVEKMTDLLTDGVTSALATAADADFEAGHGVSFVALNAMLMRRCGSARVAPSALPTPAPGAGPRRRRRWRRNRGCRSDRRPRGRMRTPPP